MHGIGNWKCRLKEIKKDQGWSQKWLGEKIGVNKSTITDLMNEKHLPSLPVAIKISKVISVPVEKIWTEEE